MPSADAYRYDRVQRAFHWSMAGIVLVAVAIGLVAAQLTPGTSPRWPQIPPTNSATTASASVTSIGFSPRPKAVSPAQNAAAPAT